MKKIIFITIITVFFTLQGYSQVEDIVDLMIKSYIKFYNLSEPKQNIGTVEKKIIVCHDVPENFFSKKFDTLYFDFTKFSSEKYNCDTRKLVETIDIDFTYAKPPLKDELLRTSPFGWRTLEKGNDCHCGIDLALKEGDTVYSVFCGKVRYINFQKEGYGNYIIIRDYNGFEILYAHLRDKPNLNRNDDVKAGDPIGIGGKTGYTEGTDNTDGAHLHFEINYYNESTNSYEPADPNHILKHWTK